MRTFSVNVIGFNVETFMIAYAGYIKSWHEGWFEDRVFELEAPQEIYDEIDDLKDGLRFCELCETKNLNGEVVGYHQGISFSMDWYGRYIYVRNYGQWAVKATQKELEWTLRDVNLDNVVTESEFEKKSGERFFGWGI